MTPSFLLASNVSKRKCIRSTVAYLAILKYSEYSVGLEGKGFLNLYDKFGYSIHYSFSHNMLF